MKKIFFLLIIIFFALKAKSQQVINYTDSLNNRYNIILPRSYNLSIKYPLFFCDSSNAPVPGWLENKNVIKVYPSTFNHPFLIYLEKNYSVDTLNISHQ